MTLREQGKRLISLREYAELLLPLECGNDSEEKHPQGVVTDLVDDAVFAVQTSPTSYRLMPGAEFSPRLYRGQNRFYGNCVPSLARLPRGIDAIYWRAKSVELFEILERHPAFTGLFSSLIEGLIFDFSFEALAQHYGYPTRYMDFSRSKDVAMFFATCAYDETTDSYRPLKNGLATLYTVDFKQLIQRSDARVLPLGLEPLPRPEAQRAFAVPSQPGENLNAMTWATHREFQITESLSQHYFEKFEGGRLLFPDNPFDSFIHELRTNNCVPLQSLESGINHRWIPPHPEGIDCAATALEETGYSIRQTRVELPAPILLAAKTEWEERKKGYFSRIRIRGICDHLQDGKVVERPRF